MKKMNGIKLTNEEFIERVHNLVGTEYIFLDKYVKSSVKLRVKHNKCGYEYQVTPSNFFNGCRCPKCKGNLRKTTEEFKKEVYDLTGDNYTVIGEYKSAFKDVEIRHNECGHHYKVRPNNFLHGQRCPKCNKYKRPLKSKEVLNEDLKYYTDGNFHLVGEYKGTGVKTEFKHNCGHVFSVIPYYLLRRPICPKCKRT